MTQPRGFDPLDRAFMSPRVANMGGAIGGVPRGYGPAPIAPAAVPADGIPVVRSPQELQRYSDYKLYRDPTGRVRVNPGYRPGMAVPMSPQVQSRNLPAMPQTPSWFAGMEVIP